jgi:hypothetical protein
MYSLIEIQLVSTERYAGHNCLLRRTRRTRPAATVQNVCNRHSGKDIQHRTICHDVWNILSGPGIEPISSGDSRQAILADPVGLQGQWSDLNRRESVRKAKYRQTKI